MKTPEEKLRALHLRFNEITLDLRDIDVIMNGKKERGTGVYLYHIEAWQPMYGDSRVMNVRAWAPTAAEAIDILYNTA